MEESLVIFEVLAASGIWRGLFLMLMARKIHSFPFRKIDTLFSSSAQVVFLIPRRGGGGGTFPNDGLNEGPLVL